MRIVYKKIVARLCQTIGHYCRTLDKLSQRQFVSWLGQDWRTMPHDILSPQSYIIIYLL